MELSFTRPVGTRGFNDDQQYTCPCSPVQWLADAVDNVQWPESMTRTERNSSLHCLQPGKHGTGQYPLIFWQIRHFKKAGGLKPRRSFMLGFCRFAISSTPFPVHCHRRVAQRPKPIFFKSIGSEGLAIGS